MNVKSLNRSWGVLLLALGLLAAACGGGEPAAEGGGEEPGGAEGEEEEEAAAEFEPPDQVTLVVHTGPGGGGDILAREIVAMLEEEELISPGAWTVENHEGGGSAVAVNYMREQAGRDDLIASSTNVWLVNELTTEDVDVGTLDLTPIASVLDDNMMAAVATDSPYQTLEDFVDAALDAPGELIQVGGSLTATDALAGELIQDEVGAEWQFLSFESGGDRKTALLRGDAHLFMTEPLDLSEDVEAGEMRPIAVIGDEPVEMFPDVPTTNEIGYDFTYPVQTRGFVGPPEMSEGAVQHYTDILQQLVESPSWDDFIERSAATAAFRPADEFTEYLQGQEEQHIELLGRLDLLVE